MCCISCRVQCCHSSASCAEAGPLPILLSRSASPAYGAILQVATAMSELVFSYKHYAKAMSAEEFDRLMFITSEPSSHEAQNETASMRA